MIQPGPSDDDDDDHDNGSDDDDDDDDWQWQITDGPHTVGPVPRQGMCGVLARPQGLLSKTKTVSIFSTQMSHSNIKCHIYSWLKL